MYLLIVHLPPLIAVQSSPMLSSEFLKTILLEEETSKASVFLAGFLLEETV